MHDLLLSEIRMCSCHRFPNVGNTCYMNAILQSLFSLSIFTVGIRREEGCWRSHLPSHLLRYVDILLLTYVDIMDVLTGFCSSKNFSKSHAVSFWLPTPSVAPCRCLTDLHSVRASQSSRQQKISLLKTLQKTITTKFSDFCGNEQQVRHSCTYTLIRTQKPQGSSDIAEGSFFLKMLLIGNTFVKLF